MRFVIADDVFLARKAVEKLIISWDSKSCIIASCSNGTSVLSILSQETVDVLVLDIHMPGVDGLMLSEIVYQDYPLIKTILVTGHADFQYAQKAVKNRVFRYLLKPLKKNELFAALDDVMTLQRKSNENRIRNVETNRMINSYHMMAYLAGGKLLEPLYPLTSEVLQRGFIISAVLCPMLKYEQLIKVLNKVMSHEFFVYSDVIHGGRWMVLICNGENAALVDFDSQVRNAFNVFVSEVDQEYGFVAYVGLSKHCIQVKDIPKCFLQAKRVLSMRLFILHESVFVFAIDSEIAKVLSVEEVRIIRKKLQSNKKIEVERWTQKKIDSMQPLQLYQVEQLYDDFISVALSLRVDYGLSSELKLPLRLLCDFDTIQEVKTYIEDLVKRPSIPKEQEGVIDEIKDFLEENYYFDITLNDLAATKYFMNPNYLSRLFKKRAGIGFSKYLLNLRMEKAKDLLQESNMNINEVAVMVGYPSTSYFISNFKKYFGETPGALNDMQREQ